MQMYNYHRCHIRRPPVHHSEISMNIGSFHRMFACLTLLIAVLAAQTVSATGQADGKFRFAIISDTHVIDGTYQCCERGDNPQDPYNKAIYNTAANLRASVEALNALDPQPDLVVITGDLVHNFFKPIEYYATNTCHIDIARDILNQLKVPWKVLQGNHDMEYAFAPDDVSALFYKKLGPGAIGEKGYMAFDHKGFRFILLNQYHCLAKTAAGHCMGRDQFEWFRTQIDTAMPVLLFAHEPPSNYKYDSGEFADGDVKSLVQSHKNIVAGFFGHNHIFSNSESFYGVRSYMTGSTRVKPLNRLVVEADPATGKIKIVNSREFVWGLP